MDNYVKRCTMFAVIWLLFGLVAIFGAHFSQPQKAVMAADATDLEASPQAEIGDKPIISNNTRKASDDEKLPDEARPDNENAVKPPTTASIPKVEARAVPLDEYYSELATKAETRSIVEDPAPPAKQPETPAEPEQKPAENPVVAAGGRYAAIAKIITSEDRESLKRLIYHESRGIGGQAVCETVFNRVLSSEFPNTISEVIFEYHNGYYQFSPAPYLYTASIDEPEAFERCGEIIDEVLNADSYFIPVDYCFFNSKRTPREGDYEYGGNVFYKNYT